jgi:hypothetical protein
MAYLESLVFQNGNLTVSGFSREGAIVPSMGIDTFIAFKVDNLSSTKTLLSINKVNFPFEFVSSLFKIGGNANVILSIYPDILTTTKIAELTLSNGVYTFPSKTIVLPSYKVTIESSSNSTNISKLIIYAKPINIYEVSNG